MRERDIPAIPRALELDELDKEKLYRKGREVAEKLAELEKDDLDKDDLFKAELEKSVPSKLDSLRDGVNVLKDRILEDKLEIAALSVGLPALFIGSPHLIKAAMGPFLLPFAIKFGLLKTHDLLEKLGAFGGSSGSNRVDRVVRAPKAPRVRVKAGSGD